MRKAERRHSQPASQANKPDTIVTCSPEMLIRCVTPVRLNRRHSSALIERWSPTASAARMPLAGVSPSTCLKRSRTVSRTISIWSEKLFRCPSSTGEVRGLHIPGRSHAPFEQPGLVVEAVRVGVAVRPAQAHREAPALARVQRRRQDRRLLVILARCGTRRAGSSPAASPRRARARIRSAGRARPPRAGRRRRRPPRCRGPQGRARGDRRA